MDKWFAKDDIPIMVVTGEGGIGKTTLVKEFLNLNLQEEKDYLLFFRFRNRDIKYNNRENFRYL
ncbi:hypothetical protein A0O00_03080 [Proteus mirabilis]|nr:hypothetical protein A0O00_03080 [Proteus mirabilis]